MPATRTRRMPMDAVIVFPLLSLLVEAGGSHGSTARSGTARILIECLPTGEVVGGYGHLLALREQRAGSVKMVVWDDLDELPLDVLGLHVLRNYLDEIGADEATRARLFRVWEKWRLSLKRKGPRVARRRELDEQIQEVLGVSRRTLLRHRAVQSLDPGVKGLLADLRLPAWALERIARLRPRHRDVLLEELQGTDDARGVLASYFPDVGDRRHKKVANALAAFVRALQRGMADLEGREGQVPLPADYAEVLRAARALINRLLGEADDRPEGRS